MTDRARPPAGDEDARPGLRGLDLRIGYDSSDQVLENFYVPALSRALRYDRSVGFFRSSALSVAARGLSRFINGGGTVRLLCGTAVTEADRDALMGRGTMAGTVADRLAQGLVTDDDVDRRRLEVLAWLAREGRLEVRIAVAVDDHGTPIVGGDHDPYFHEKIGVLRDVHGDGVAFQGSVNESATAWTRNFESFSVYSSWDATATLFSFWTNKFEQHWSGDLQRFRVYALPDAAREALIDLAPESVPGEHDPEEAAAAGDDKVVAHFLRAAPRLIGSEGLAGQTVGVDLFPHQRQVVERLAGLYPRSWLVADEVGLGKTISAGMALRRLLISGRARRALILAPANVCRQWQDELFEKFGLWVPRLDGNKVYGVHPSDVTAVPPNANPYAEHRVLIASSHLARRPEHQDLVLAAGPYDVLVVDEAHHARRNHAVEDRYRPGRLLELLDKVTDTGAAKAVWLLTATPMQVAPIELRDLLSQIGLHGRLSDPDAFERYFREIAKQDDAKTAWAWLDQALQETPRLPMTGAEHAVLDRIRQRVGPVKAALIERFGTGQQSPGELLAQLDSDAVLELRTWLKALSPVAQYVTRHSRETLKIYRARGMLSQNLADRDVQPGIIPFDQDEQALYNRLDELIDRLMQSHGTTRGAGFVLTVYRRRLTSSWAAIRSTLARRLDRQQLALDDDLLLEAEESTVDVGVAGVVNDTQAVPLTPAEIVEIRGYIDRLAAVSDSKFARLRTDLDTARGAGHSTIVFTQFTDTLDDLRERLVGAYRSQLGTFTGSGGRVFRDVDGWVDISKRDLVDAIRARTITVLLATDAASEGLNLQACSFLINYDMPWNPMRVEQRIGRIDRLGQMRDVVHVRNYFIPETVEESVYKALAGRIDDFRELLGNLQPVLGATERAFQHIFKAPRSERIAARDQAITELLDDVDDLRAGGIDFAPEDDLPLPEHPPSPVTLEDLREVLVDRFACVLDQPDRPVTWSPSRASRDPESWTALGTYGHPQLDPALAQRSGSRLPDAASLVLSAPSPDGPVAAVRADRTPPEPLTTLAAVDTLGSPTARGDAEAMANGLALQHLAAIRRYESTLISLRQRRWVDGIVQRFVSLVHETVAAGCAESRFDGSEGADPLTVWLDLVSETTTSWGYARAFQQKLGIPLTEMFPDRLREAREPIAEDEWSSTRQTSAQRLSALMAEYRLKQAVQ